MDIELSNHIVVKLLSDFCDYKGITKFVISAGSRNAPLILTFSRNPKFDCYSITDERSAAFFALGMAERLGEPVGLICTSGTAMLNYAPAVAEAYYKGIPLVVMSADRPLERLGNGDGQMINQEGALVNISKYSCSLPEVNNDNDEWHAKCLLEKAIKNMYQDKMGPVHINVPLREPLYDTKVYKEKYDFIDNIETEKILPDACLNALQEKINGFERVLVIPALSSLDSKFAVSLEKLAELPQVVVLTETVNNLKGDAFFNGVDKYMSAIGKDERYIPDLVITCGDILISRKIKAFINNGKVKEHWHINQSGEYVDLFQRLTTTIDVKPDYFFSTINMLPFEGSNYRSSWNSLKDEVNKRHLNYLGSCPWCDLKIYDIIKDFLTPDWDLHLGNSTVVRYAQLFNDYSQVNCFCNRGTSGIDGALSTAVGSAYASNNPTLVISGDLSFYYDSNALWNKYISDKLKIVVINNEGGGIFRFIEGPSKHEELTVFFENHQQRNASSIAEAYGFEYYFAEDEKGLRRVIQEFIASSKASILEIKTPRVENDEVLRQYFEIFKN